MFAKVVNGVVEKPYWSWQEMRNDNPDVLFPSNYNEDIMKSYGAVEVIQVEKPAENHLQSVVEQTPQFIDGVLTQVWSIISATESEVAERTADKAEEVRSIRNDLLVRSDYTQAEDFDAQVDKQAWATYRQSLRDISSQDGFPWTVTWPDAP